MNWRDDPRTPVYWLELADLLLASHPEWKPFVVGPRGGYPVFEGSDERFFVEIPSVLPTIREPLTIEVADRLPSAPIDTYWNGYFEHQFCGRDKSLWREQIASVVRRVEEWTSDEWGFRFYVEPREGRLVRGPVRYADGTRVSTEEMPFVQWSWRGTHDRTE